MSDIKLNRQEENVIELNKEQLAILNNVSKYVKVGGYLYYSTCSILKRENVDIVKSFIKENEYLEHTIFISFPPSFRYSCTE